MKKSLASAGLILAMLTLAGHLGRLPASLEDLDSINFALGVRDFNVAQHQPHPPGYPVFIAAARVMQWFVSDEAGSLALVSLLSAAVAAFATIMLFGAVGQRTAATSAGPTPLTGQDVAARGGALLTVFSPLFLVTAVRPLSDMFGLAMALVAQWLAMSARTATQLALAAFVAGLGVGVRSQVVWLTLPLLAAVAFTWDQRTRVAAAMMASVAFVAGALLWAVPLVTLSGGPAAYLQALASQGGEDFTGVAMLATQPSPRLLLSALYATLVAPWNGWLLAGVVLVAALIGAVHVLRRAPRDLAWLLAAFGPYALFHLIFQETATTRYALPLVVPTAYLAMRAIALLPSVAPMVLAVAVAMTGVILTQPMLRAYAAQPAPAFRVLADMTAAAQPTLASPPNGSPTPPVASGPAAPVLAMHRRQELDMRRPLLWNGATVPQWSAHLPAPPKHEWLELVKYWNAGGRAPVWFLADPPRSDLRLIDRRALHLKGQYRWPFDASALLGGVRPNVMDWYQVDPPGWYAGEGWALTPETAGVSRDEGKGLGPGPVQAWIRRRDGAATLMVGGRKLSGAAPTPVTVAIDGRVAWSGPVVPGFFLQFIALAPGALAGTGDYATLTVTAGDGDIAAGATVAIEQFDVQDVDVPVYGYGDGWQELEYNPVTGRLWRWTSERAVIRAMAPQRAQVLHLEGDFETAAATAHLTIRAGTRVLAEHDVPRNFTLDVPVPADAIVAGGETQLTIESDQWYVPAETNWRPTEDRRHLALRMFVSELR